MCDANLKAQGDSAEALLSFLENLDYIAVDAKSGEVTRSTDVPPPFFDVIAKPIEKREGDLTKLSGVDYMTSCKMIPIFTSIAPHLIREAENRDVTEAYLGECLSSCAQAGFELISLNAPSECDELKLRFPITRFQPIDGGIPRIHDFLDAVRACGAAISGIANCDCVLRTHPSQVQWLLDQASHGLVMMERLNFSAADLTATGVSCNGFDAFIFAKTSLDQVRIETDFRIGETWWDYDFPLHFMRAGVPLAVCSPLLHLDHPLRWDYEQWARNAKATMVRFGDLIQWDKAEDQDDNLAAFAGQCFHTLRAQSTRQDNFAEQFHATIPDQLAGALDRERRTRAEVEWLKCLLHARDERTWRRMFGETLCTLRGALRAVRATRLGNFLYDRGVELQRQADGRAMAGLAFCSGETSERFRKVRPEPGLQPARLSPDRDKGW